LLHLITSLLILEYIIEGKPLASLARKRPLNTCTILYHKCRFAGSIAGFFGADIIIEIQRRPAWKDSMNANREKLACREERRCQR
jgi:hypothetical protein